MTEKRKRARNKPREPHPYPDHPIKVWRHSSGRSVTLRGLAAKLGCSPAHLSLIENYKLFPSLTMAFRIFIITGIHPLSLAPPGMINALMDEMRLANA